MKSILLSVFLFAAIGCLAKPNVVFILTDDLGYGDVGFAFAREGTGPAIATPFLDELAGEGVVLTDHYCAAPVCAPSRASLLTGVPQPACSVRNNDFDAPLLETNTLATVMKAAGYRTYAVGKWGVAGGGQSKRPRVAHPCDRGFDHFYGYLDHLAGHTYFHTDTFRNGVWMGIDEDRTNATASAAGRYSTELFTEKAKAYATDCVRAHAGEPFFIYLAYTTVHGPFEIPGEPDPRYRDLPPKMARYATCVSILDRQVRSLVEHLDRLGVLQDTVIVFTSDNGPAQEYGSDPAFFKSAGPFRGKKRDVLEGGMRVPTFVWRKGGWKVKRDAAPSAAIDWLPTLAELAGASAKGPGVSLLPRWTGDGVARPSLVTTDYWFGRRQRMSRVGDCVTVWLGDEKPERYDVRRDPAELVNLEGGGVTRKFREPRLTRGNTNVFRVQPIDEAAWVWMEDAPGEPVFLKFRKEFTVAPDDAPLVIDVSADERYYLTCDGAFVSRGPNRAMVENWQYNTYELRLEPGKHVLEAVVWRVGKLAPLAQISNGGGFVLKADGAYDAQLTTGRAAWKVGVLKGLSPMGFSNGVWGTGVQWEMDGVGLYTSSPDRWTDATVVRKAISRKGPQNWGTRTRGWMLFPSQLPDQTEDRVHVGRVAAVTEAAAWRTNHVYTAAETNDARGAALTDFIHRRRAVYTVPAHTRLQVAWDLGRYYCAYPVLTLGPSRGARVSWAWAESTERASDRRKGSEANARNAIVDRDLKGYGDVFVAHASRAVEFSSPWFRCGKWCRLDIQTGDEPLQLRDIALIESHYPIGFESEFSSSSDPSLGEIRRIGMRSMEMCCHEMLFDCPYYEQQMYPGDTRVQLNVLSALSRDERMIKRAIELFDLATRDDGQCPFNWPTRGTQEGATYTLCYLLMYGDYVMNHADRAWLRARLPGLRKSLSGMEYCENADGLLENLPGWSFMDWVPAWQGGVAPGGLYGEGLNVEANLLWVLAMQAAARVERVLGNENMARHWEEKSLRLKAKIVETFWSPARGLLADTPAKRDFSEHAQALAIIGDVLPKDLEEQAFAHLIADPDLSRCTVYFSYYLFEAYFKMGRGDLFLKRLDLWRDYVKKGLTTTQEQPDTPEQETRSDCHAWGAHPIWWMQAGLAGIRSDAPFFAKVRIAPCPGPLKDIFARYPHPQGRIEVRLAFADDGVTGLVETPVPGVFVFRGREIPLHPGLNQINIML